MGLWCGDHPELRTTILSQRRGFEEFVVRISASRCALAAHVDAAGPAAELLLAERELGP